MGQYGSSPAISARTNTRRGSWLLATIVVIVLGGAVAVATVVAYDSGREGLAQPPSGRSERAARQTAKEAPVQRLVEIARAHRAIQQAEAVDPPGPDQAAYQRDHAPPAPQLSPRVATEDRRDYVSTVFDEEQVDRMWAAQASNEIRSGLERLQTEDSRLDTVECRSSLCKVEVTLDNDDAYRRYFTKFFERHFWDGPGMVTRLRTNQDGSVVLVMFLGKFGTDLPELLRQ